MNQVALKLKSSLTCSYCSKIYKEPIELTCGDLICQAHLKENEVAQMNKIKCGTCKQVFQVKGNEFKANKFAQAQINNRIFLSDEEIALKQKIEESIKIFYEMYDEFTYNKTKLDLDCHEHFQEIRFKLDMHRDELKQKIDDIYMAMIEKTKEFEGLYLRSLDEEISSSLKSFDIKPIDEELNEIEQTFRDPNLLFKTIEDMHLKQQESINRIQPKLDEMIQVKEHLKALNDFRSNLSFEKNFFGQLNLNEYSRFDPFESKILAGKQPMQIIKLCEFGLNDGFKLIYRASEHGFGSSDFHSKCDGHANTLTIFKASESSFIFGGFTTAIWDSTSLYKPDAHAFLFSLTNKDKQSCKMKIDSDQHQNAIYCDAVYGPTFDNGHAIYISSNANTSMSNSNLGYTYKHPKYDHGTSEAQTFLAGSNNFLLSEIEVYQKE